jgi:hypothetical protein
MTLVSGRGNKVYLCVGVVWSTIGLLVATLRVDVLYFVIRRVLTRDCSIYE